MFGACKGAEYRRENVCMYVCTSKRTATSARTITYQRIKVSMRSDSSYNFVYIQQYTKTPTMSCDSLPNERRSVYMWSMSENDSRLLPTHMLQKYSGWYEKYGDSGEYEDMLNFLYLHMYNQINQPHSRWHWK